MIDKEIVINEINRLIYEINKQRLSQVEVEGSTVPIFEPKAIDGMLAILHKISNFINSLHSEHSSEDLEEAASRYAKEEYSHTNPATLPDRCIGCYAPLMYAFIAGANWQKQQMLKSAVNGIMDCDDSNEWVEIIDRFIVTPARAGEKVKILIIKEDE